MARPREHRWGFVQSRLPERIRGATDELAQQPSSEWHGSRNRFSGARRRALPMLALAHHYDELLTSTAGRYRARVYGQAMEDGMWGGWIVFFPVGGGRVIATDRETTQSNLDQLAYWASGLTHTYLHGALDRALTLQPEATLSRELDRLERLESAAATRAVTLEGAAEVARAEAE